MKHCDKCKTGIAYADNNTCVDCREKIENRQKVAKLLDDYANQANALKTSTESVVCSCNEGFSDTNDPDHICDRCGLPTE